MSNLPRSHDSETHILIRRELRQLYGPPMAQCRRRHLEKLIENDARNMDDFIAALQEMKAAGELTRSFTSLTATRNLIAAGVDCEWSDVLTVLKNMRSTGEVTHDEHRARWWLEQVVDED